MERTKNYIKSSKSKEKNGIERSTDAVRSKTAPKKKVGKYTSFAEKYQNWYDTADKFVSRKDSEEADPKKLSASKEFGEKKDYSSERWAWDADSFALSSERSTNGFKSEAQKLLEELENDKDYFSEEGYNAYKEFLTSVTNSDYTDVNEALKSEAIFRKNIGNKDVYNEYVTNAKKLSRLGINENTTRSDLKKMLIDDDNAPVTQKLSNDDRSYIEKLTNSRDFIQTMTPDEIRDEIEMRKTIGTYKSPEAKTTADVSPYAFFDNYDNPVTWEEFLELSETEKLIDSILEAEYDPNSEGFSRYMRNDRKAIIEKIKNNPDAVTQFSGAMKDEAEKISTYYQYLDAKEQAYGRRKADSEWASKNFVNAALATAYGIVAAPSQIFDYAGNILSGETSELGRRKNVYDDKNIGKIQAYNEGVTSLIDESIDNDVLSWLATTAYSGVTSMSQSMVTGVVASALFGPEVGSAIALSILGSQAASSSYNQAIKNGSTYGEAVGFSVAAGFAEAVMEKMPLDNILKNAKNLTKGSFKEILVTALKNTAYQGLIEGGEELGTSIIDNVADMLINGDKSQFNANIERYVAVEGLSYDEAYKQAAKDQIMEAVESIVGGFIGGAASGGSVEIGKGVANSIRETNERTAAGREILSQHGSAEALSQEIMNNLGLDRATYEKLFKRAEKLSEAKRNKKGEYSGKASRLAERVSREAFAAKEESGSVGRTELIQKKLESKGISNDEASTIAKDIASDLSKGETIEAIKDKYTDNETVVNTITELTDPESESYDSSLSDFVTEEKKAMAALAYGRAHFDTEYSDESGRIDEAKTELGEITDFIEIKNEDGETDTVPVIRVGDRSVPASEIYLNGDSIYNNVNGMNVDAANAMISAYKSHSGEHIKAADFAKEWKIAYEMGLANRKADSPDFVNFSFSISKEAAEEARSLGAAESRSEREATKSDIKKAQKKKSGREGKISTEKVKNRDYITDSVMVVAKTLSLAGYNIELFEDVSESADRGSYSWNTNTIRLNVAVGTGRGAVNLLLGRTLSHEITHSIQRWSPDAYEELKAFVIEKMGDSFEGMVSRRMKQLGLDRADAIDEIVAYSCEMMLRDSKALTEFAKQHRTLFEKICDVIEEFINKIRNAISSLYGADVATNPEAKFMQLYADELQAVFDKALSEALNESEATVDHFKQADKALQEKDLIALHNITEAQLADAISKGGIAGPSISINKKGISKFGEISIVFTKESIDPEVSADNKLYGSDAWTPNQTTLKKNAVFDEAKLTNSISEVHSILGEHSKLFDMTAEDIKAALEKAKGDLHAAFDGNIGLQTAYALKEGFIDAIPENSDGSINTAQLREELKALSSGTGVVWGKYRRQFVESLIDSAITSYDAATADETVNVMREKADTAKKFKLTEDGTLTVPAARYRSVDALKANKGRLSESASESAAEMGKKFIDYAKKIADKSGTSTKAVVEAINKAYEMRYRSEGIVASFAENGITITKGEAQNLRSLYKNAVELPAEYFEAKAMRVVPLSEAAAVVAPQSFIENNSEIVDALEEMGVEVIPYKDGSDSSRLEKLNSLDRVKFSRGETFGKNKKAADEGGKVQYSKGKSSYDEWDVQAALYDVLDHEDTDRNDYLIKVGTMPKYIVNKLGIDGDFYIYRNHIYENMVSKEQAIEDGRYAEGKHYHDLGFETTEAAIMALENPILSIASKTDKNNPAVIMILPVKGKNGTPLYSVMSLYSEMSVNGDFSRKPHVVLSIYERNMAKAKEVKANKKARDKSLEEIIREAVQEGKVFDFDKKMRDALSVIAEQARLGDITDTSLDDSLTQFRKEIKTFKEKNKIQYSRGEEYDPYAPYVHPAYATMPEYSAPLEGNYDYQGEGYTAANGLKLFAKYSVDTARDFIMSELMLTEGKVELARDLNEFYTFMATARKLTWDDIEQRAGGIADRYLSRRSEKITRDPRAQEALDTIRGTRITFDEKQKADAKAFSGSFGKYRQSLMGRVSITTDGIPLDSQWQEWADLFPEYFPADTNSNDMPRVLFKAIQDMKNARADDGFSLSEEEEHDRAVQLIYDSFRRVTQEAVSQEAVIHGKKKVYGDSLIDALERTVQTQEDKAIINRYRSTEADVQRKRMELAAVYKEMNSALFTPMDEQDAYRLQKLTNDRKALNKEIKTLERDVKKARDDVAVTEGVIRDPNSTESARSNAFVRVAQQRQALARIERTLSAKKSALTELEAEIENARNPRVNALKELKERAAALRLEISEADRELLDMRSTKIFKTLLARERALAIKETKELVGRRQRESAKRQENTALRQRIWKELQRLDSMLALPSVAKHIPDTMRSTVALLSKAVPGRNVDYDAKIAALEEKLENSTGQEYREAKERMAEYLAKKEYANRVTSALSEVFESFDEESPVFDEEVYKEIEALKKEIAGKSLDELENSELKRLHDVICATKAAIKNADRVFGERRGLADLGMEGTEEVLSANDDKARGPIRQKLHDFFEAQSFSMLKPYELFELTGSTVLYERFRKLQAREGVYFRNVNEASEYYKRVAKEHGITDRMLREKFSFTTSEGREIALSINEIMSIYLMKDRAQAMVHLTNPSGGFRFAGGYTVETKKAKKAKTTDEKMKTVKYVYKKTSDPVHLTDVDVISIANMLTKEQKAFANAIQRYMADVLGDKGNEVSMALHDFQKYNDPNYFPIHTDESYRLLSIEKAAGEIQLKNLGFTKDLKHKASGPLVLENMTDVFARHANEMSLYHAFAIELENMKRVLNFSDPVSDEGGTGKGMKAALGQAMTNEIVDFIKSVNGGLRSESMGVADTMISLNKAARVGASLSVAIQQPSAILRSFAMIDPKYFVGIPKIGSWEEMKKYTATAGIKELGGVDVNTSKAITDQLTELDFKGRTAGANISKAISKVAFILPEMGDRVAWISLWNACKREAAETYRGEAILIEAGKRFDEIVNRTQVYDSVFSRSKLMRSKNTFAKMVTAFMAEPMTTANMMIQAFRDIKSKNKSKIKAGMRAVAAVTTSVIINNALVAFIYAMRDDDEDESYVEKYIEAFLQKMGTDVNPVTYIPVFKDVLSLIQGYDVERMDMSLVSDVIDEAQSLYKLWEKEDATEEDWMNAWLSFGGRILDFAGVPISNAVRDGNAIKNLIDNWGTKHTKQGLKEAAMDGLFEESNIIFLDKFAPSDSDADKLYRAIVSGDTARYNQITKRLDKEGKTTKQIQSLIVTGLKNNDERVTAAAEARNTGDLAKYEKLLKEITKDGFASSYVSKAVESIVSKMNEEPPEGDEFGAPDPRKKDKYSSIYNADDIFINLEAGDVKEAQVAIDDIYINKYNKALSDLKDDENEDDAVRKAYNSMRSMISNDYRPLYKAGDNAERERIEELLLDIYINGDQLYGEFDFDKWKEE